MDPSSVANGPATPLTRHQQKSDDVIRDGSAQAIKALYVELGEDIWAESARTGLDEVPILSVPETLPVVVESLAGIRGLVLDAGCGPNPAVSIALAKDSRRSIVALDIGWGTVRTALAVARHGEVPLLGVAADVEYLPFRGDSFDGLVCDDTIEHLPNDVVGVAELSRVLKTGARAVLATPNRHSVAVWLARFRDLSRRSKRPLSDYFVASSHLREYLWPEFQRLVRQDFQVERRRPIGWSQGRKRLISPLLSLPGLYRMSQMIVLVCRPAR
jgi:ubiquinone/menaquinone biosynthesis C-methylase UbiE